MVRDGRGSYDPDRPKDRQQRLAYAWTLEGPVSYDADDDLTPQGAGRSLSGSQAGPARSLAPLGLAAICALLRAP